MKRDAGSGLLESKRWLFGRIRAEGISTRVADVMERVPREEFVPPAIREGAYVDTALPIGHGQTISQPSLVALMTDMLRIEDDDIVLEVGTGSGYQAAILAGLAKRVYSLELVEPLAVDAAERLRRLGYANVRVIVGDGYEGWPEGAPYDAICVTASAPYVPAALLEQLANGGRMIIPVGDELRLVRKDEHGGTTQEWITPVAFVPLVHAEQSEQSRT